MAERVNKLPADLREDANLGNGIYVGSRHTDLNFACAPVREEDQIVLGSCSDQTPKSVYIDDKKGEVYIPTGQDVYLKLDGKDGIEKEYTFGKRLSMWWESFDSIGVGPSLMYVLGGSGWFNSKEVSRSVRMSVGCDYYSYVLDHASEEKFQKNPELILRATKFWFGAESAYQTLAKQKLLELASNRQVNGGIRVEAAEALGNQALLELAKDQTLAADYRIRAVGKIDSDFPEDAIAILLGIFNDSKAVVEARVKAVNQMLFVFTKISEQKIFPDRIPQVRSEVVKGLQNWQGEPAARYEIAKDFGWFVNEFNEVVDLFYQTATNPKAGAGDRVYAWKYVLEWTENPAKKEEASRELLRLAQNQTVEAKYRELAARAIYCGDDEEVARANREESLAVLLGLFKDSKVDAKLRWNVGESLYQQSSESREKIPLQEILAGLAELLKNETISEAWRLGVARTIFLEAEKPEVLAKAIDFYLEREEEESNKVVRLFAESRLLREATLLRLDLIKQRLSWHDLFDRIWVALETRRLASPETAPVAEKDRKLIVQIEQ